MRITLLGAPGAGKGTQAALLATRHGLAHISTGALFRAEVDRGTDLGRQVKALLDAGHLVPDATTVQLLSQTIDSDKCRTGFVLDGFPRTLAQAQTLDQLLIARSRPLQFVIEVMVPEPILLERIKARGQASGRSDDNDSVARERLRVFKEQTAPVIEFYRGSGRLLTIDGLGTVEEVYSRVDSIVKK